ncbi:hypothetical protein UFOVP1365_46 [uncultured Caudovirales phage]|uniref:Uncharacterized protein n=1 Tax=uncultured Caudovirales phage TaxID=2100421 RepID=A0A6J5S458_9CAUD|nr:hypothetical protein UFOVP1365_46 [uncultured Caudovirales phage]
MITIYVVCGEAGEYELRNKWNKRAFLSKDKAEEYRSQLAHGKITPEYSIEELDLDEE